MTLTVSSPSLVTDGVGRVTVRATVKDANNAAMQGQTVNFSASDGTLSSGSVTTGAGGVAEVVFNTDDNKANRITTITATHGSLSQQVSVNISGTAVTIGGATSAIVGQQTSLTVTLKDGAGNPIAGRLIQLSSSRGNFTTSSRTTNHAGQVVYDFTPTVPGDDLISASSLGALAQHALSVTATNFRFTSPAAGTQVPVASEGGCQRVQVELSGLAATAVTITNPRGTVHADQICLGTGDSHLDVNLSGGIGVAYVRASRSGDASIMASVSHQGVSASTSIPVRFFASSPASLVVQGSPTTVSSGGASTLVAFVRDAIGNPVSGRTVLFTAPEGGGSVNPVQTLTDEGGRASTVFTADSTATGSGSVRIVATVPSTSVSGEANLTVSGQAVNVRLGTDNQISTVDPVMYRKVFGAFVTDSSGNPVSNQEVTVSLRYVSFDKGEWLPGPPWTRSTATTGCVAEDPNNDGQAQSGEPGDVNGNGHLDPNGSAWVRTPGGENASTVTVTTDNSGAAAFWLQYPQNYASWVRVEIYATAIVSGQNNTASSVLTLPFAASAINSDTPPAFRDSPFGVTPGCDNHD